MQLVYINKVMENCSLLCNFLTKRAWGANMRLDRASGRTAPRARHYSKTDQNSPADNEPMSYYLRRLAMRTRDKVNATNVDSRECVRRSASSAHSKLDRVDRALEKGAGRPR